MSYLIHNTTMSVEEKNKLLKCLKYYDWMTEEEKQTIFAGMLQMFTTIKRVKLRAKCDLVPKKKNLVRR